MRKKLLSTSDYQIFLYKSLFVLGLAWGGFLLTLVGFFYAWIAWFVAILLISYYIYCIFKKKFTFKPSLEMLIASSLCLLVVVLFSSFSTPTVFSGRDQGSFSQAAIRLSQNHKLEFSTPVSQEFFKLHEQGRALNFPGFYYDASGQLLTQFTLVYISWLAIFFATFGIFGFLIANGVLLYAFLFSFYLLVRLFIGPTSALPTALFTLSSFSFMWFSKYTLSENIALPLVWLTILTLMLFLKQQRKLSFFIFLSSVTLLCFARIEGIALLTTSIIILLCNKNTRDYIKRNRIWNILVPISFFLIIFIFNAIIDRYFYKEILKAILPHLSSPKAQLLGQFKEHDLPSFYIEKIFFLYGLIGFFLIGAVSTIFFFCKKEIYKLTPLFVVLPTFIYFFDANISTDHPWMLRRFVITILPIAIFYSGLLIGTLLEKKHAHSFKLKAFAGTVTILLIIMNLPAFSKYLTFSENKNLLAETKSLSEKFSNKDLILIDRETTGDGWSMIADPMSSLFGKNAVYFFNTQDLAKINTATFENVFLIASNQQASYYQNSTIGSHLSKVDTYEFTFSKLNSISNDSSDPMSLPEKQELKARGTIFKINK